MNIKQIEFSLEDMKEIKEELRRMSDSLIRLEEKFEAHKESDVAYHEREAQYRRDFIRHLEEYRVTKEEIKNDIHENTSFRNTAIKHFWLLWAAAIGGVIKFIFLK